MKAIALVEILWSTLMLASFHQRETPETTTVQAVAAEAPVRVVTCLTTGQPPVGVGQTIGGHSKQNTLQDSHMFLLLDMYQA